MDSDADDLPYIVWYQCRMCTHLFFDDVEKMFTHLDKKHGAMIDCDELRSIVYKNGLCMGGLSRSPKSRVKSEDDNETEMELITPFPHNEDGDEEDGVVKLRQEIDINEMVLPNEDDDDDDDDNNAADEHTIIYNLQKNGHVDEEYQESAYQSTNNNIKKFELNLDDDEEQLVEEDDDVDVNGKQNGGRKFNVRKLDYDECENDSLVNHPSKKNGDYVVHDEHDEYNEDEDSYHDEDNYHDEGDGVYQENGEEGELLISAEQSINEEELDEEGLMYEDDGDYDEMGEEEESVSGVMYTSGSNQTAGILNYGYSCKYCGKFFTTRRGVDSHEQHHKNQGPSVMRRPNESRLFPCKICKNKSFTSFKDLKMHVKSHTPERIHICKFCFSTFNNTASLTKHLIIHTRENPHKCHCGKTFVSANTLKIHKKIHTGVKPFVCSFLGCLRAFVTKSTLESHLRTHTGEKPYQCSFCPSSFTTSSAKYRHERHVHKVPEPTIM